VRAARSLLRPLVARAIPHLCGMPKRLRDKRQVVMFRAFFDETGLDQNEDSALVLGGFFGRVEEWERASDAWDRYLLEDPKIEYFSRREANSLSGQFYKFSRESSDAKVLGLAETVAKFNLLGFCASIPYSEFASRDAGVSRRSTGSRVYDWGFFAAISGVLGYMQEKIRNNETVDFIFDERNELRSCISTYYEMKASGMFEIFRRAGQCNPGTDDAYSALQMADLLAWEFSNYSKTKIATPPFSLIAAHNEIIPIERNVPPLLDKTFQLHKASADISAKASELLRRYHKEKDRTPELLGELRLLGSSGENFTAEFQKLIGLYEGHDIYNEWIAYLERNEDTDEKS
jgi:hypothetical protein